MGAALRYWQLVCLNGSGKLKRVEDAGAKAFFQQHFAEQIQQGEVPDATVQAKLWQWFTSIDSIDADPVVAVMRQGSEACLRCLISQQIERTCADLGQRFGNEHGFTSLDLLPYVLSDQVAIEILRSYNPNQGASLATWTAQLVKHNKDLNQVLLENNILLISDWAILNDTKPEQVRRILSELYLYSEVEVQQACSLLTAYHAVYLRDRRVQRQNKGSRQCLPPTLDQQQEIADWLRQNRSLSLASSTVLGHLQSLAQVLRRHRIQVRSRIFQVDRSLEQLGADGSPRFEPTTPDPVETASEAEQVELHNEFLAQYRQELESCLEQAIAQICSAQLKKLKPPKDQQWLQALYLLHCRGLKMAAIAPLVGLRAQDAVSRLLKLKELRAKIRHCLLGRLSVRIQQLARAYVDPTQLENLDQSLSAALAEEVEQVMQGAEGATGVTNYSASQSANQSASSLFARKLCHYLDTVYSDKLKLDPLQPQ